MGAHGLGCGVVLMLGAGDVSILVLAVCRGNIGALACVTELLGREDKEATMSIVMNTRFVGPLLYLLWNDVFDRSSESLSRCLRGCSYDKLCDVREMLESGPLGIREARIAVGVDEVAL